MDTLPSDDIDRFDALTKHDLRGSNTVRAHKLGALIRYFDSQGNLKMGSDKLTLKRIRYIRSILDLMCVCSHSGKKHKARYMCNHCYVTKGNPCKATECPHKHLCNHSRGLCRSCYQKIYYTLTKDADA